MYEHFCRSIDQSINRFSYLPTTHFQLFLSTLLPYTLSFASEGFPRLVGKKIHGDHVIEWGSFMMACYMGFWGMSLLHPKHYALIRCHNPAHYFHSVGRTNDRWLSDRLGAEKKDRFCHSDCGTSLVVT